MSVEEVLIMALLPLPVADAVATVFFFRLFMRSAHEPVPGSDAPNWRSAMLGTRSWLLGLLTLAFGIITVAFIIVGFLAAARIFDFRVAGGIVLLALALLGLGAIPPTFMVAFWQSRRRTGGPPPFSRAD